LSNGELPPEEHKALLYDATRCIGCRVCENACQAYNQLPDEQADELTGNKFTVIKRYMSEDGTQVSYRKYQCMHCVDPACASACPVGALHKLENGPVVYDGHKCIGCRYCMIACPFRIPRYEYEYALPQVRKCQLCNHRYKEGKYSACCEFCPTGASIFGKVVDLRKEAQKRLSLKTGEEHDFPVQTVDSKFTMRSKVPKYINHVYGQSEAGGTQYIMLAGVPFDWIGFNKNIGEEYLPRLTWEYIAKIPAVFAVVIAAGTIAWAITSRKNKDKGES